MQNTIKRRIRAGLKDVLRRDPKWFLLWGLAGLALRLTFALHWRMITPDSLVYGDIAKNWIQHHVYGLSTEHGLIPTDIRLPGYPAFLAFWFLLAGMEHYGAAILAQVVVDLVTCGVIGALAWRVAGERAAKWAFAMAAISPFIANHAGAALTETLSLFFAAVALLWAVEGVRGHECPRNCRQDAGAAIEDKANAASRDNAGAMAGDSARPWLYCGLAIAASILLRPDGGILLIAIGGYLLWRLATSPGKGRTLYAGLILGVASLTPLAPWTVRNALTFGIFQPLVPATAMNPGEFFPYGFTRWERTWMADYASMEDVGYNVDGAEIDPDDLPRRAFDSDEERRRTTGLLDAYNEITTMTPELDAQFAELARQRIRRAPLRYYVWLPAVRAADMWFRPPTQLINVDTHWWRFDDPRDSAISLALAAINAAMIGAAAVALLRRRVGYAGLLLGFVLLRTVLVTAVTFPEPRYILECYPVVLAAAAALARESDQQLAISN